MIFMTVFKVIAASDLRRIYSFTLRGYGVASEPTHAAAVSRL